MRIAQSGHMMVQQSNTYAHIHSPFVALYRWNIHENSTTISTTLSNLPLFILFCTACLKTLILFPGQVLICL